jgi:hypothetical protein
MLRSLFGTDWRKSPAHLLLLSKFLNPRTAEDFAKSDNWKEVLKESPQQTIKRFIGDGMLTQSDLSGHVAYKFKVTELKNMLKQCGLPVSGRKEDLIACLVQADADGMKKATAGLNVIHCTEQGRVVAEQYLNREKEKRARVEQQVMEAIQKRKCKVASQLVAAFEAEQVFQRGIGIDWKNYNPSRDMAILSNIFDRIPNKLTNLNAELLDHLRVAAGMMHLWGTNRGKEWLSASETTGLEIDTDSAIRMLLSFAMYRHEIADYKRIGVKTVRILTCNDSHVCDECRKLASKNHKLNEVPEWPYEKCTSELGCRCWISAAEFSR